MSVSQRTRQSSRLEIASRVARLRAIELPGPLRAVAFVAGYLSCAWLGNLLTLAPELGAFLWPPSGLLLGVLLRDPKQQTAWIGLAFAADLAASLVLFDFPPWLAVAIAAGNCLEAASGAMLLRRWARGPFQLHDVRSALAFVLIAAAGTPLLSMLVGGTAIALYSSHDLLATWRLWWSGDAIGVLVVAPIALSLKVPDLKMAMPRLSASRLELAALFLILLLIGRLALDYPYPVAFVMLPLVIWAAVRYGFAAGALAVAAIVGFAVADAAKGQGQFIGPWSLGVSQFLLQSFAIVVAMTGLIMAGLAEQVRATQRRIEDAWEHAERQVRERTALLRTSEQQLQQAVQRLLADDRAKDDFMFTLAHELRNPLSTLQNGLAVLEGAAHGDRAKSARDAMSRQLTQAGYLIDELSDLARIKSGKMSLTTERVELRSLVECALHAVQHRMDQKGQTVALSVPDDEIIVIGDKVRLTQAVTNLLTNANRYTQRGGAIRVEVYVEGADASVAVTDNGPGIPEARLAHIFEMYDQAGRGDTEGLGIGLAVVKRIVELHGGHVSVRSAVGQGSTFTMHLTRA